ncbi:MAG: phage Gp37/Gp68 family protein [Actinobacteria bacterium]|nr:phage Gp37/Gp68 family protein [Actinomycetota bacterium]
MSDTTGISWTDATWNPVVGCERTSPGCDHCYAIRDGVRLQHLPAYVGTIANGNWTGTVRCLPERLDQPLRWKRPRRIFVDSMSDLFHPDVPDAYIQAVFEVMAYAKQHTFQVLTKRPQRMAALLGYWHDRGWLLGNGAPGVGTLRPEIIGYGRTLPLANVQLGVSIESDVYTWRANHLRKTPAAIRFLSLEPLLGPLPSLDLTGIDWVIVGGESGPDARPMHPDWARDIRDRCVAAGIPFTFKQWGTWVPLCEFPVGSVSLPHKSHNNKSRVIGAANPVYMLRASKSGEVTDPRRLDRQVWEGTPA